LYQLAGIKQLKWLF